MKWFEDAKLGIFMHWGIYGVKGVGESWSFYREDISYEDYMAQLDGFTAERFNPVKWAELFKKAGAKYTVLTTKHHDGVALWDTKVSDLNVVKKSPAARDLIAPYTQAMKDAGLKVGYYFSHLDWSHPDYASIHPNSTEWWATNKYTAPPAGKPDDYEKWERFLKFHRAQLKELLTNYGEIDLLWFDGVWERTSEQWKFKEMREFIRQLSPETLVNHRIGEYGDYDCPEQGVPIVPPEGPWELCMTLNDHWGYVESDHNYKSLRQIVKIFTDCVGMGGNLLLDIGPKPDGTIRKEDEELLTAIGNWIEPRKESIYGTVKGLPFGHYFGPTSLSKDKKTLYLFYFEKPIDEIQIKGLISTIKRVTVLGDETNTELKYKRGHGFLTIPGIAYIELPEKLTNDVCTVIKVELEDEIEIYRGKGEAIKA